MNWLDVEIPWECSRSVRAALEGMGRTEDVCFAPSGRRLAFAGFARNRIGIADVEIGLNARKQRVLVSAVSEFTSTSLQGPHGVDFLDETTIVVGNRWGTVVAFHVPPHDVEQPRTLEPIELAAGQRFESVHAPGSLRVARSAHGAAEILVCNNLSHVVTRHRVDAAAEGFVIGASEVVLRRWLVTPDGVAISRDGWVAVSNHDRYLVMLYERSQLGDEACDPVGVLRGVKYPHGLRFTDDGAYLFVADAGTKNLHLFARAGDSWRGVHFPALTFPVIDEGLFLRGRANPREGGPKGIDIERSGRVLAVTGEHQRLRFFDVEHLIAAARPRTGDNVAAVDYELAVLTETDARVADAVRKLDVLRNSRSFRLTAPLRSLNREVSTFVRRWRRP